MKFKKILKNTGILIIGIGLGWFFNDMNVLSEEIKEGVQLKEITFLNEQDSTFNISLDQKKPKYLSKIYEYTYEYNTEDLIENHYIEFDKDKMYYYGTSDDFDQGREGYLPGFFYCEVFDFKSNKNKINFSLTVSDSIFYKEAISPILPYKAKENWDIGISSKTRKYKGEISGDTIFIETENFDLRKFIRLR